MRLVSAVKRSDVRPSSASPSLTRANRAFRSSGDLLAVSSSSRNQRFSMPREERGPSKTGSTSSVERPGGAGRVLRSSAAAVGSLKSADGTMRRSSSMDSTKLLLLAGGRVGSRSVTGAAAAAAASPGGLQRLQDRARKMSPKAVAVAATSRSGGADKRRNDPWKKNQTRRGSSGSPAQGLNNSVRLGLAGDRLLPGGRNRRRPGDDVRSSSVDASPTDETKSLRGEEDRDDRVRSGSLQPSASLTLLRVDGFLSRLPSPDYDDDLNARMELVYEQYKNDQLGVTSGVEFKGFDAKKKTTSSQLQRDRIGGRRSDTVTPHHPRKDGVMVPPSKSSSPWTAKRPTAAAAASPLDRDRSSGKAGSVVGSPDRAGISSSSSRGGSPEARGRGGSSRAIDWHDTAAAATADRNLCKSLGDISDRHFAIKATEQNITPDTIDDADLSRAAKPRKDDRLGPPTRIPLPVGAAPGDLREQSDQSPTSSSLTRFDSGVDITNVSPTFDGGGFSIGEAYDAASTCRQNPSLVGVQCAEACSLSEQRLAYVAPPTVSEEEFY